MGMKKLAEDVSNVLQLAKTKENNTAQKGVYTSGYIKYGKNYYPCEVSTDIFLNNGDSVVFLFNSSHTKTFIVGA